MGNKGPAASRPTMRMRRSSLPNIRCQRPEKANPIERVLGWSQVLTQASSPAPGLSQTRSAFARRILTRAATCAVKARSAKISEFEMQEQTYVVELWTGHCSSQKCSVVAGKKLLRQLRRKLCSSCSVKGYAAAAACRATQLAALLEAQQLPNQAARQPARRLQTLKKIIEKKCEKLWNERNM